MSLLVWRLVIGVTRLLTEEDSRGGRGKWDEKDLGTVGLRGIEDTDQGAE